MTVTTTPAYVVSAADLMADYTGWASTSNPTLVHALDRFNQPSCQFQRTVAPSFGESGGTVNCDTCLARIEERAEKATTNLNAYAESVRSGKALHNVAMSHRGMRTVSGYMPMARYEDVGRAMQLLGKFAAQSPQATELAVNAMRTVNAYGTMPELVAKVAESFAATMREPFDDVLARTGPEPCRHRDAQKPWSLAVKIRAQAVLSDLADLTRTSVPGYGWALVRLAQAERVTLHTQAVK